jgi:hypothetical protein
MPFRPGSIVQGWISRLFEAGSVDKQPSGGPIELLQGEIADTRFDVAIFP